MRLVGSAIALVLVGTLSACGSHGRVATPDGPATGTRSLDGCSHVVEDSDDDGLSDECEASLVSAFAPVLLTAPDACREWKGPPRGGYLHGAQPVGEGVRLVYLPAYLFDCGWTGMKCLLPWVDCTPHAGDSEFIAIDVAASTSGWVVEAVFLSAHCFGRSEANCRWYRGEELNRFAWVDGAPMIWVSEGRHANYPSRAACDRGHFGIDTCDRNTVQHRFPTTERHNIGSEGIPLFESGGQPGCLAGADVNMGAELMDDAVECFWSDEPFHGWQGEGEGATAYLRYLEQVAEY